METNKEIMQMFLLFPKINAYGGDASESVTPMFFAKLLHAFNETTINTKLGAKLQICS